MVRYKAVSRLWRRIGPAFALCYIWSSTLATGAAALASAATPPPGHVRSLNRNEMRAIVGRLVHRVTADDFSGSTFPWEGNLGGLNTFIGNKLTSIPIVGWTARGGMPVQFTLN